MTNLYLELKIEIKGKEFRTEEAKLVIDTNWTHLRIPWELSLGSKYVVESLSFLQREELPWLKFDNIIP